MTSRIDVDSLTEIVAASRAAPIPLGLNQVVALLTFQEHLLAARQVLHVGQTKVSS